MNTTIMIRPSSAYFVFIPADDSTPAKWITRARIDQIHLINSEPLKIEIFDDNEEYYELEGAQAQAVVTALIEFPHGKMIC